MKKVRKGNDIAVSWSIVHEEQDFDLTSLDTTLYLINIFGKQEVKDYKKEGNRISWTFHGKDQKNTGKYSLMLVLNEGGINMHTIDACDFVELTSCSCQISEGSDNDNVTTEVIELSSVIDYLVVDDQLDADSANPISNAAVTQAINAVGERILDLITIEAYSSALMQEAFEKYNLATKLNTPISCLVKYNSTDTEYQSVFLVVEEYVDGHKLNFITFNATSYVEVDGSPDPEWQWSPKCRLINGICDSYLIQPNGYVIHLGKGALIIADDKLDSESDRPISNKAICEALNNVKLFEVVSALPAQGDNNKVYLVASISGETENLLTEYIWVNDKWEKLGEFKADVDLSKYAKKSEVGFVKDINDNIINDTSNSAAVGKKNIIIGGSAFIQGDKNIAIGVNGNIRSKNSILIGSAPSDNDDKLVIGSEGLGELLVVDENNKAYLRGFGYNGNRNGGESSIDNEYRRLIEEIEKKVSADNLATINGQSITEGGNIVIEGGEGSYDDTEIREELSKKLEGEVVGTTTPTEGSIGGSYDDTEIRQEIAELSEEVGGLSERVDNLPSAESSVFEAIYGVTTYDEIAEAYNAKKHVIVWRKNRIYNLSYFDSSSVTFTALSTNVVSRVACKPAGWVENPDTPLEESQNKITSLSSASTDTQYPSAKAVYDAIQQSGGGGASTDKQGVVSQTLNYNSADNTYSVSNVVRGLIPSFFIDLVTEAGASFNAESGYFSLNGIDNIAYDEMRQIYNCRTSYGVNSLLAVYGNTYTARTNFAAFRGFGVSYGNHLPTTFYTKYLCTKNASITKFVIHNEGIPLFVRAECINNFEAFGTGVAPIQRSRLEEIIGIIDVTNLANSANFFYNGAYQPWLTSFQLKSLNASIDLSGMPRLGEDTILYMINNEKAASAITIKLHADAKAMADASEAIQSALANHANITLGV